MSSQVVLCALLVVIQGIIDDELEVRGSGSSMSERHEVQSQQIVRRREGDGWFGGDGAVIGQRGIIGLRHWALHEAVASGA